MLSRKTLGIFGPKNILVLEAMELYLICSRYSGVSFSYRENITGQIECWTEMCPLINQNTFRFYRVRFLTARVHPNTTTGRFRLVCSVTWSVNASNAGSHLALIQTSLLSSFKCKLVSINNFDLYNKSSKGRSKTRSPPAFMFQAFSH